jgi:N4-gp56 family major capsid protein
MATGMTTPGNFQPELPIQAAEDILSTPRFNLVHSFAADLHYAQPNMGDTTRLSRMERLSTDGGRLDGSGLDPAPEVPVRTDIDAKVEIYAKSLVVNEQVDLFNNPGVQAKYKLLLGQWLAEKEDLLMRDLLADNAVFISATGGLNADNPTEISRSDVNNVEQVLLNNDARTMMEVIEAENKFGTGPVRDAFVAMCNTAITPDLQNVTGVLLKANYADQKGIRPEEYASIGRFRFFVSSKGAKVESASLNGATIYKIPMSGMEGYAKLEQNGYSARVGIIPNYAMSNVAQNYGMYAKFAIARAITNQNWVSGLKVTKRL